MTSRMFEVHFPQGWKVIECDSWLSKRGMKPNTCTLRQISGAHVLPAMSALTGTLDRKCNPGKWEWLGPMVCLCDLETQFIATLWYFEGHGLCVIRTFHYEIEPPLDHWEIGQLMGGN